MKTQRIGWALVAAAFLGLAGSAGAQLKNTRIAFTRDGDIWVMGHDGSNEANVTNSVAAESGPAWSPDGAKIAYASNAGGSNDIYVMDADGANAQNLTNLSGTSDNSPAWSPDGAKIAFLSLRDGDKEVYVMDADGSSPTNVSQDAAAADNRPSWSPDGTLIAFDSTRDGGLEEIYVVAPNGSNPTRLTNNAVEDIAPAWSPDGSKIAYLTFVASTFDIVSMDAGGSAPTTVVTDAAFLSWSPDGSRLVYPSSADGNFELYTVSPDGTGATRLTDNGATDHEPSWSTFLPTDTTVTVADTQGQADSSVTIPVQITDTTGLAVTGISFGITYDDTLLTPTGATPAAKGALVPAGWSVEQNVPSAGLLQVSLAGGFGDPLVGSGVVVDVTFDIAAGAAPGATSDLTLTQADLNEGAVSSTHVAGTFTVLNLVYGDVTGNGAVTSYDASWVLEYVATNSVGDPVTLPVESSTPVWASSPLSNADAIAVADVDGDASVGAVDASLILQHDVELITEFPVEAPGAPSMAPVVGAYGLSGVASSTRPGARIVVTLDASEVADLLAGELRLDFDPVALRAVTAYMGGSEGPAPMLAHHAHEGRVGVAFAAARPIEAAGSSLHVVFEAARNLDDVRSGVIEASRLRLNGATYEPGFRFAYSIEPYRTRLMANFPNPFNPETWIPFELSDAADVTIHIYAVDGRVVRTLELGALAQGMYADGSKAAYWDGRNSNGEHVSSGVYVYELRAGEHRSVRRMTVLK